MADVLSGSVNVASASAQFTGVMDQLVFWFFMFLFAVIVGGIAFYFIYTASFKHRLRLRIITKGRKIIKDYKVRPHIDRDGIKSWQLLKGLKRPELIPPPPPEAIEITDKGRMVAEAYYTDEIGYQYIEDKGVSSIFKDKLVNTYAPITTNQRILYLNEHKKRLRRKQKDWKQNLPMYVGLGSVVIIVICLFAFWGEIVEPFNEASKIQAQTQAQITEAIKLLKGDIDGKQYIGEDTINSNTKRKPPD